jgi:hypothetical protein
MTQANNEEVKIEQVFEKAWADEAFKQELLNNPKAVLTKELGLTIPENVEMTALEETPNTRYLVIPKSSDIDVKAAEVDEEPIVRLIARAAQDPALKQELLSSPKAVIKRELGISLPEGAELNVVEETENTAYFLLPQEPSEELSEEELEAVSGGWIGAAVAAAGLAWDVYKHFKKK